MSNPNERQAPALWLALVLAALASIIWGISNGIISGLGVNSLYAVGVIALAMTGPLLAYGRLNSKGRSRWNIRRQWLKVLIVAVTEAVNTICLYQALRTAAPTSAVVAISMTAPVLLLVVAIVRRSRPATPRAAVTVVFMSMAFVIIGTIPGVAPEREGSVWLGIALSFVSAVALAVELVFYRRLIAQYDMLQGSGLGIVTALIGLGLLPAFWHTTVSAGVNVILVILGVLLALPTILAAQAMRRMSAITYGSVSLTMPFWTALTALVLYGQPIRLAEIMATGLIVAAIYLNLRDTESTSPLPKVGHNV